MHGHDAPLERADVEALAATRVELGRDYEPALLDAFADRVEATIARRVEDEVARARRSGALDRRLAGQQLALGIISLVATIPISITLAIKDQQVALLITLAAIVAVNVAHAALGRQRR